MVLFFLYLKAELENVGSVTLNPNAKLRMDVGNPLNDYETREKVVVDPTELVEVEDSKLTPYHFGLKWEGEKHKVSTLTVKTEAEVKTLLKKKKKIDPPSGSYTAENSGDWVPILAVECRGLEPKAFHPMGNEFVVSSAGGKVFDEDVDLGEGDWADYDEENDGTCRLSNLCSSYFFLIHCSRRTGVTVRYRVQVGVCITLS